MKNTYKLKCGFAALLGLSVGPMLLGATLVATTPMHAYADHTEPTAEPLDCPGSVGEYTVDCTSHSADGPDCAECALTQCGGCNDEGSTLGCVTQVQQGCQNEFPIEPEPDN